MFKNKGSFVLFVILFKYSLSLKCVDEKNNPVDWYVVYKLPLENNQNSLIAQGLGYVYMTSKDSTTWLFPNTSINDTNSIIGRTLNPLFTMPDALYVLYNDESPDGAINFKKGHTKGLILGDSSSGLWLIHSVPRFPSVNTEKYFYPHNGLDYGQSFLCISLDLNSLNAVGLQLQYNLPYIYSQNIPSNLRSQLPHLIDLVNDKTVTSAPWYHLGILESMESTRFFSFAKGPKFVKELYLDWVAPTLGVNLYVETWLNGPGRLPSDCSQRFKVNNVDSIAIKMVSSNFKSSKDHSKWAVVPANSTSSWICIGDINREESQRHRGGGTVCFAINTVVKEYQKIITQIEGC